MIFYFSGTGNTRWVAEQIAQLTGDTLYSIPELIRDGQCRFDINKGESVGFCFPTHGWQPPRIVREFVRTMVLHGNVDFCWALTTCGDNMGELMTIFNADLAAKGLQAESLFSVIMPETYVCLPFMYTDSEAKVSEKVDNARRQIQHIARLIRDKKRGIEELDKGATPRLYSYVIGQYFNKQMISDKKFTVDQSACIKCGRCKKVCPVENIQGTPPKWMHKGNCTCCLACYHHCPVHAINYGRITKKRGQYFFKP